MSILINILTFIGLFTAGFSVLYSLYKVLSWFLGISPVLFRLGLGLSNRKLAIFSDADNFKHLEKLFIDSKLFKKNKIISISPADIDSGKQDNVVFLLHWDSFKDYLDDVINIKDDNIPLIIYAKPGIIPHDIMEKIGNKRNTVVVNFRGRLLNDILTSLITTGYQK